MQMHNKGIRTKQSEYAINFIDFAILQFNDLM